MFSFFPRAENATGLIGLHSENRRAPRDALASNASNIAATFVKTLRSPIAFRDLLRVFNNEKRFLYPPPSPTPKRSF